MDSLKALLRGSTKTEIEALGKILGTQDFSPKGIVEALRWNASTIFGYVFTSPSYKDIVRQVADKLRVKYSSYNGEREIETEIAKKVMKTVWEKMTPSQRNQMEREWRKTAQEFDKTGSLAGTASIFGALTAAQLSGFSIYLLATTSLGAISGAIGVALPFAAYTMMTSAIAVIIGPVGWLGAGLFAVWKLTGPNYKKLIPAILCICALRSKPYSTEGEQQGAALTEQVIALISEVLENVDKDKILLNSRIVQDLGADSLHVHDLVAAIEHEFNITVSHRDMMSIVTVRDLVAFVRRQRITMQTGGVFSCCVCGKDPAANWVKDKRYCNDCRPGA